MGTRAQFFVGNPQDVAGRKWLGTVAWDGYPDGDVGDTLEDVTTEEGFVIAVAGIAAERRDFCDPAKHGFPFPWHDDLFLTDCTYAFFDGRMQFTYFHSGWIDLAEYLKEGEEGEQVRAAYNARRSDVLPSNVPAPTKYDPAGPDSIMIISAPR